MITLLKHELIQTRGTLAFVAAVVILVSGAGTLLAATGWPVLAEVGFIVGLIAVLGLVPAAQIMLTIAYWRSSYGRTGYLTQTLPVRGSTIYWAKMLWTWMVSLAGAVLSVVILLAASPIVARGVGGQPDAMLTVLREGWTTLNEMAPVWGVVAAVATMLVMILIWPTQYFFAASIGAQAPLNRMGVGGPILVWLGLYLAVQVLTFLSFAAVPLAIGVEGGRLAAVHFNVFAEMAANPSGSADVMPIGFVPALLLATLACIGWTVRSWNRRVSLV